MNDKRIKVCLQRYDTGGYSRQRFLRAISYSMGPHTVVFNEGYSDDESIDESADNANLQQDSQPTEAVALAAPADGHTDGTSEGCEVCLVQPRDARIALVPCGHQRFCASCADEVFRLQRGCPICRGAIQMILRLY